MSNYTVQKGETLWSVVKKQFGLSNSTAIANKVNEVARANHISNPNSIFAGKELSLDDTAVQKSTPIPAAVNPINVDDLIQSSHAASATQTSGEQNADSQTGSPQANSSTAAEPTREIKFDDWALKCADSIKDVNPQTGEPVYGNDVESFDMAGADFTNDIKSNGGKNAAEIYKQRALATAKSEVGIYDADKDGTISAEEQVNYDISEAERKYGKFSGEMKKQLAETSARANVFMDLDKNGKVDEKEFAAFMYAMDANNGQKVANGKISREEYVKSTGYFDKPLTPEAGTFRGTMRASYKGLFGFDPAEKK